MIKVHCTKRCYRDGLGVLFQISHSLEIFDLILGWTARNHLIQSCAWQLGRVSWAKVIAKAKM